MENTAIKWKTIHQESSMTFMIPSEDFEIFSHFPEKPYNEGEEFSGNNLVIGSAGFNYTQDGIKKTEQVIFRLDPGHKQSFPTYPHINQDLRYNKLGTEKRTRMPVPYDSTGFPHIIKMAPEMEITMEDLDKEEVIFKSIVSLE